jgi:hypothetical membrane protein
LDEIPDETDQLGRTRLLFAVTLAGIALYILLDALAQSLPPYYSPVSQPESDLAVGPYGFLMALNFVNRGGFSLCFLFALLLAANSGDTASPRFIRGAKLFSVWSVGAMLLAVFPTDVPPTPVSWHGAVHLLVAVAAFLCGAFGALYLSLGMTGNRSLSPVRGVALSLSVLASVLSLVEVLGTLAFPGPFASFGGLVERVFLGSVILWIGAVAAMMLKPSTAETSQGFVNTPSLLKSPNEPASNTFSSKPTLRMM